MKELLILRHGKSQWPQGVPDRDRPIAERGERETKKVGRLIKDRDWLPEKVLSSPARRARETAEICIAAAGLTDNLLTIEETLYSGSVSDILDMLKNFNHLSRVMIVGHNPTFDILLESLCPDDFSDKYYDKILSTANLAVVNLESESPVLIDLIKSKKLP